MEHQKYVQDWQTFTSLPGGQLLPTGDPWPCLGDDTPTTSFDAHYFYQDIWAARHIAAAKPLRHVDVGSRVDYVGFLTAITSVVFVDIRPLLAELDNYESVAGSILDLPFDDMSVGSLSCLHVAEHIGLGRYGDPLDPLGTKKAAAELSRVLAVGGDLYFSLPVGASRVCFNAHRIHAPGLILEYFSGLKLVSFAAVSDSGRFHPTADLSDYESATYSCGLFHFQRP